MANQANVWVVDDDQSIRWVLERALKSDSLQVTSFESGDAMLSRLERDRPDVVLSDIRMPGIDGFGLLEQVHGEYPDLPIIIMTAHSDLDSAVASYKGGAFEYLPKPFDIDEATAIVMRAVEHAHEQQSLVEVQPEPSTEIIGEAPAMQEVFRAIGRLSQSNITVLINGESGTGKELVAQALHQHSPRAAAPFIPLNMAAIPKDLMESELFGHEKGAFTGAASRRPGRFEQADGGTLFLDEIGELPLEAQARLLRFLQEGEIRPVGSVNSKQVDVRLVAATHRNLKAMAKQGQFREDLYYRLYVMELQMPPLRERGQDILDIAQQFLRNSGSKNGKTNLQFSHHASQTMLQYRWPGNVRELQNAVERAVILADGDFIDTDLLGLDLEVDSLASLETNFVATHKNSVPAAANSAANDSGRQDQPNLSLDDYFHRFVLDNQDGMSETALAKKLGISRKCLWERRQKLGIPRKPKKA